jgi:hypothetical protein
MSDNLKEFLNSGKRMITDTKLPKAKTTAVPAKKKADVLDGDEPNPHKRFVKNCVKNRPDAKEMVKEFEKFIEIEEAKL